ncbi:xanthine dehydrogenase family protein subunit M [Candidatus Uabimicrobium sp. HlEnr_7]|uniref:FAD binding domain-containing protein n=1 Tax=Candidatus Uabimicrobium helgolandensis TaxID=3095367 RepID=UPI0035582E3E
MNKFEYTLPKNVDNALHDLDAKDAILKAGGVDVLDLLKEEIISPKRLVNIRNIKDLSYITKNDSGIVIGANTTLSNIAASDVLDEYQLLKQAAHAIATPQVRNMATLAGNLCQRPRCWYYRNKDFPCSRKGGSVCYAIFGENQFHAIMGNQHGCSIVHPSGMATALLAVDARLKIATKKQQKEIALADFFVAVQQDITKENVLQLGDIITEIIIPKPTKKISSFYYKQKQKQSFDWPIAEVAVSFVKSGNTITDVKIVLGAAAPTPVRASDAEKILEGKTLTHELAASAGQAAIKKATPMSQNEYKVAIFKTVVKRTVLWAAGMDPYA